MTDWPATFIEWTEGGDAFLSVPFTWDLPAAHQRAAWLTAEGYRVRAGGPAVSLMPGYLADVAEFGGAVDALTRHNPDATFTSRGCIRHCSFCAVPQIEGDLIELADWPVRRVICDNNLLACSRAHFDKVIDRLKPLTGVDFQGLDARLLTNYHASRLAELDIAVLRLAWDDAATGNQFMTAYERLRRAKVPKRAIRCYVLIGYKDTPADALFRLRTCWNMGIMPNPMRYNTLDALTRDSYVGEHWTDDLLRQYMRYWANLQYTAGVPFEEWLSKEVSA